MPIFRRGNYYYGYTRVNGVTSKIKSTGCSGKDAALAVVRDWERCAADPAYASSKSATVGQACKAVLDHYAELIAVQKKAKATGDYYTDKLGTVARILGPFRTLASINAKVVDQFITHRRKEKVSEHNISKELGAMKLVLRYALRSGDWSGSIDAIFPRFERHYKPCERTLNSEEVSKMLLALPKDYAAQLAFAIATSAEAKCLLTAQRTDISKDAAYVLLRGTKRELRWRTVPIVTGWQKELLAIAIDRAEGKDALLFRTGRWGFRTAVREACKKAGVEHFSPNDLRRTFAVHMRESGFPLELIAPLMGHSSTRMLEQVYGRLSPEQLRERLVTALNVLAPVQPAARNTASFANTEQHQMDASTGNMAPRAGFEPATHGLTGRAEIGEFHSGAFHIDPPTESTVLEAGIH
jgi:integrase